jgi:predicted ATP-grasp superfamily ATP-dependent carboligase
MRRSVSLSLPAVRAPYQKSANTKSAPRILVLDANQRSALAVTRSLGAIHCPARVTVLTADTTPAALAGCSRFSSGYLQYPSPATQPQAFLRWLSTTVEQQAIDWVFPTTEISSQLILLEPQALQRARLPFAELGQVMALADKWELVQTAARAGVQHPRSAHYADAAALLADPANIPTIYPAVLKPCQSRRWLGDRWLDTAVHIAHSEAELRRLLQEKSYFQSHPFMLQEFIPGHGAGLFALYDRGRPVTFFAHRRLREKPPRGGVSVLSASAPLDPQLHAAAVKLLDAVQWHGVAMIEFRVTAAGEPYLMEVNTRFWGSLQLAIDAGVDFPALLLHVCNGVEPPPLPPYRIGQRLRWLLGDVDSLYLALRDRSFSGGEKLRRLLEFLTPHPLRTRHEVNRWSDPGPAWYELKDYLRALRR